MGDVPSQPVSRHHVVLGDLLGLVGPGVLSVLAAPDGLAMPVGAIVIQDPLTPAHLPRDALVLAVGVEARGNESRVLLEEAAEAAVSAVVFREHPLGTAEVVDDANRLGVVALGMPDDAEWASLFGLLRTALAGAEGREVVPDTLGAPMGDLFALADAIAAFVGGPVTIEDPHSVVLSYSSTSEPMDEPRRATILGRHSPATWSQRLRDAGVFRRLWAGEVVRYEAPDIEGFAPRLAVGVRAGDEVLGSIWVAEGAHGFGPESELALQRAAHVAALHLVHQRAVSDVQRVARGKHLRSLLEGHGAVEPLAAALDLDPRGPFLVLAAKLVAEDDESLEAARDLTVGLVSLHVGVLRERATSVVLGDAVYVLVPDQPPLPPDALETTAREIAERLGHLRGVQARVAIGPRVADLADIGESRRVADLGLRVLERMPHAHAARTSDLADQILLLESADAIQGRPELLHGKLDVLIEHDAERGTQYVRTLRAYLDAFGDVGLAADCLGVHPNTFRYRLHRIVELADLDLDDPDARLAVELRLRLR